MREGFWQNIMGLCMLALVAVISAHMGILTEVRGAQAAGAAVQEVREPERPVVVIDSGHGGNDPGKIGVSGQKEKDINLKIAGRLKEYLEAADVEVVMTRETDAGLYDESDSHKKSADMKRRCEIIDGASPDLAISIHQNSYHQDSVKGPQMFYFAGSEKGALLAEILQKRFDYVVGEEANRRSPKANNSYYLLLNVKAPIVIAECGFLSNPAEAALLSDEEYQDKIAWTLHVGILQYLNEERAK